jgi:hypothetical protein
MLAATTRFPSQAWVTQQLRNATPFGPAPRFLIRDRDDKFGTAFDALAHATGIRIVRTAIRSPNMNAVCERFLGSLVANASTTCSCSTTDTSSASSPSMCATTTPPALTKGSISTPRS